MISLSSRDFELISCPCPKKGQNSAYHRLHVDPSSQSREPWETASKTPITSIGRRPLSYINLSITVITLLQAPKTQRYLSRHIRLSSHSYRSIFLSLGISNRLYIELSQERDTQYQRYYQLQVDYFATSQKDTHLV